jgi:hypothetical protein
MFLFFVFYDMLLVAFLGLKIYGPQTEDKVTIKVVIILRIFISIIEVSK